MTVYTVSRPWRPQNGKTYYGTTEIRMADDFQFDVTERELYGLVILRGTKATFAPGSTLRIIGRPDWFSRFDDMDDHTTDARTFPKSLGMYGGRTALCGIAMAESSLKVDKLEITGVPGAGVYYRSSKLAIEWAHMRRVGWPVFGNYQPGSGGATVRRVTSVDRWLGKAWQDWELGTTSLRLIGDRAAGRGELCLCESGWELSDFVCAGDGAGFKCGGTDWAIRRFSGGWSFAFGADADHATRWPGGPENRHLHECTGLIEDSQFCAAWTPHPRVLLYIGGLFAKPLVVRRCVFRRNGEPFAIQQNQGACVVYENCAWIGWGDDPKAAVELGAGSTAEFKDCEASVS